LEDAQNNFLEGLAIAREVGHPLMISVLLHRVAWANHYLGNTEGRLVKITEAYHWSKMSQNAWGICFCANSLADMKYYVGQLDEAEPFYMEGLELSRRLRFPLNIIHSLLGLALIAEARGDVEKCRQYNKQILQTKLDNGYSDDFIFESYLTITEDSLRLGELDDARYYFRSARLYMNDKSIDQLFEFWLHVAAYFFIKLGEYG